MNTIPTIFNERKIPYTVLGKSSGDFKAPVSVLVLNRGARYYLSSLFQNLIDLGFNSIVFVDSSKRGFEVEALSSQFPEVKFLLPLEKVTAGEMIISVFLKYLRIMLWFCGTIWPCHLQPLLKP